MFSFNLGSGTFAKCVCRVSFYGSWVQIPFMDLHRLLCDNWRWTSQTQIFSLFPCLITSAIFVTFKILTIVSVGVCLLVLTLSCFDSDSSSDPSHLNATQEIQGNVLFIWHKTLETSCILFAFYAIDLLYNFIFLALLCLYAKAEDCLERKLESRYYYAPRNDSRIVSRQRFSRPTSAYLALPYSSPSSQWIMPPSRAQGHSNPRERNSVPYFHHVADFYPGEAVTPYYSTQNSFSSVANESHVEPEYPESIGRYSAQSLRRYVTLEEQPRTPCYSITERSIIVALQRDEFQRFRENLIYNPHPFSGGFPDNQPERNGQSTIFMTERRIDVHNCSHVDHSMQDCQSLELVAAPY